MAMTARPLPAAQSASRRREVARVGAHLHHRARAGRVQAREQDLREVRSE